MKFKENEVDGLAAKFDSLNLRCLQGERASCAGEEILNDNAEISQDSFSVIDEEEGHMNREASQDELARIKNDNYHLKLALGEKQDELMKMKKVLEEKTFMENVHRFLPTAFNYEAPGKLPDPRYLVVPQEDSPTKKSISDTGFVSHLTSSPYKGNRSRSVKTESSLASTKISKLKDETQLFHSAIMPFIQAIVNALKCSMVFKDEAIDLQNRFMKYMTSKEKNQEELMLILNDIEFCARQMVALLNRELHFKEISQRLEFLFAIFLDPTEYDLQPQEHLDKLKEEIIDSLIKIFDYQADSANILLDSKMQMEDSQLEMRNYYLNSDHSKRLRHIEEGIDLCADAMQQVYGGKESRGIRSHTRRTQLSSRPSTKSENGILCRLSQFNNTGREKNGPKGSVGNLEFIPIGYDESILERAHSLNTNHKGDYTLKKSDRENDSNHFKIVR